MVEVHETVETSDRGFGKIEEYRYWVPPGERGWVATMDVWYQKEDDPAWTDVWVGVRVQTKEWRKGQDVVAGRELARKLARWAQAGKLADLPEPPV